MQKFLLAIVLLSIPWSIMARPSSESNPGEPFEGIEAGLERNFQATQEIPDVIFDSVKDLFSPPGIGAQRWISPNWEQSQSNQSGAVFSIRTTIHIFNPDRINSVTVNVRAYLPDGSEFTAGFESTVPTDIVIPPFGQASLKIRDFTGESHRGAVVIQADGPVLPGGSITRRNLSADSGSSRTMIWYPDHASGDNQDPQDPIPAP